MNLRQYITIMLIGSVLCWVSWFFVVFNIDPFEANFLSFVFFYVSMFFALVGTFALILFWLYKIFDRQGDPMYIFVRRSFRDSLVVSGLLVFLLFLAGRQLLNLWNFVILVSAALSLFVFIIFNKKANLI